MVLDFSITISNVVNMMQSYVLLSSFYILQLFWLPFVQSIKLPSSYDTVWTTQSSNSAGSMPVGGGDVGLNVWAESGKCPHIQGCWR